MSQINVILDEEDIPLSQLCRKKRDSPMNEMYEMNNLEYINKRINDEYCHSTFLQVNDLMDEYKKCPSVKSNISLFEQLLDKHHVSPDTKSAMVLEWFPNLIPAGTKGVKRGNKFNEIVKKEILSFGLDSNQFEIQFEKKNDLYPTNEKPDWYIFNKQTKKAVIGMNQLDLWSGGAQSNRGAKYVMESKSSDSYRLLSVVCNKIQFEKETKKEFQLFKKGFENNTLCYLKNLKSIVTNFL
jgi:hypothetical protein